MTRSIRRGRTESPRWAGAAALAGALIAAEVAYLLLRPRHGLIAPRPVDAHRFFTGAQIERARDFRRPQLGLYAASLVVEAGVLVLALRVAPRRLPRGAVAAGAVVSLALTVTDLPIAAISRQRGIDVGLVTQSWGGWAGDVAKSAAIGAVVTGFGAGLAVLLRRRLGTRWWIGGAAAAVVIAAAFLYAGPVVLDPLFNRFTKLPDGPARTAVLDLARRAGVKVGEVYVVDASRRTTAANAYVTGLGPTKRVVIYDTLLKDFTPAEARLVVAHELGHVRYRDVPNGLLYVLLVAPFGMLAAARLAERWSRGEAERWVPALLLALGVVSTPVTMVSNQLSRRVEARADAYSLRLTGEPEPFVAFQRRIAVQNVADPDPPAWLHALLGTHPTTVERIGIAEAYAATARRGD